MLARALDADRFDTTFARPRAFDWLTADAGFRIRDLSCQDAAVFSRRLRHGLPLYDYRTLAHYVEDDLALIDSETPDVVIGDFRLSLSVSARLRGIPYVTICDAYWSPERPLHAPLPVLGFTHFTPIPLAELAFRCISGLAFRIHALPMERLRAKHGLSSLHFDLRRCYTDADLRLFANFPALFSDVQVGPKADFIGPLSWSPDLGKLDLPDAQEPIIYVTMGSSGSPAVLNALLPVLEETGHRVAVATAGKPVPTEWVSKRTSVFEFLPGDLMCQRASLVVCNGGSPTTNQALANGVPVLGIAQNMDQFLNMRAIVEFGAGLLLRADRAGQHQLRAAIAELLGSARYTERAHALARTFPSNSLSTRLTGFIDQLFLHRNSRHASTNSDDIGTRDARRAHLG